MTNLPIEADRQVPVLGFAAGTRVHTQQGLKPIEQIQVGDWVLSHPANTPPPNRRRQPQEYTYRRVTGIRSAESQPVVAIRYGNFADDLQDSLRAAPAQSIWSKMDGWIAAASIRHGQAVVLSFNGNALVLEGKLIDESVRVHALQVEEFGSYFVEQLGAWVRSDGAGRKLAAPAARPPEPFDFGKPQTLLKIENFYNDTLAEQKQSLTAEQGEQSRQAAERKHFIAPTPAMPEMQRAIDTLRSGFAQVQKRLNATRLAALSADRPSWMNDSDALNEVLRQQALLLAEGQIVWGGLVQANKLMFAPGNDDCPALLVYSADRYFDAHPDELRSVGREMFALKGTSPADPVLKAAAELVSDEADRAMGFRLPAVFSSREINAAVFMVFRKHIPQGVLTAGRFPVLTHPSTQAVMIVPFDFWPLDLLVMWNERRL